MHLLLRFIRVMQNCVFVDVIRCEAIRGTVGVDGIYVISSCPRDYAGNDDVKEACETDISSDVIHQLPVSGGHSSLVYRNIYCAACHNEPRPQFWLVSLTHCEGSECQLAFHPISYLETVPRTCLRDVSTCADDWHNATLAMMCRQAATSFLTDGRRVFPNHYCARCNHVDDAQLHCVQVPSLSSDDVTAFNHSRLDVVYDLNVVERQDDGKQWGSAMARCNNTQVYDPLLSRCVALPYCASSWPRCTQSMRARRHALDCPTGLLCINSSDHIRYGNGSVFVLSLQTLIDSDNCRFDNETVYICTSPQTLTPSLTLFSLHDAQRLLSVVATVVGLLALVALLSSYCLLVGCRRDNTSKMSVCFVISILFYHVMYVVVLAGSRLQFIATKHLQLASLVVCAGLQYFAMAAFFWLHVLSVEVLRAVRLCYMTDVPYVTSCTALLVYSLYAWCVPAMIVGWSSALPLLRVAGSQMVHQSQSQSCCVLGLVQLLMFVIPTAVSLLIDVVLYVLTALMLCQRSVRQYDTDTLLPDRHSPKVDTQWTTRSWSAERLDAQRRAADAACRRWNDLFVTCMQTSLLLATTWTFCLLPATGWIHWPDALWYVYILLDLALMLSVSLSWSSVERVWYVLVTRKRDRCCDDRAGPTDAVAAAAAVPGGRLAAVVGRRTTTPAFNDAASLRAFMRETSI